MSSVQIFIIVYGLLAGIVGSRYRFVVPEMGVFQSLVVGMLFPLEIVSIVATLILIPLGISVSVEYGIKLPDVSEEDNNE